MAYCTQCGKEAAEHARFCSSCGNNLRAERKDGSPTHASRRGQVAPKSEQRGSSAGVQTYKSLTTEKATRRLKAFGTGAVFLMLALFTYRTFDPNSPVIGIGLGVCTLLSLIATLWFYSPERLSQSEYQALPGSVTEQGHQCVFCGGRGIYRHTPYKTDTTLADCSKCKAELWFE